MALKVGDVVILKSGGPLMTIDNIGDYSMSGGFSPGIHCVWFEGQKKHDAVFHPDTLELYDSTGSGFMQSNYNPLR